jgi:predicted methyltransferase
MASFNPWSTRVFDKSLPIEIIHADVSHHIDTFPIDSFTVIVHDPPVRSICKTDLYGLEFYKSMHRVLHKRYGRLFHYIGNPDSKTSGQMYKGVIERLRLAGFKNVVVSKEAFGVSAIA